MTGNWGAYSLSATADRNDTFYGEDTIVTNGSLPRISFNRGERPLAGRLLYFGVTSELATILRSTTVSDVRKSDQGLTRLDVNPTVRIPFTKWPFLSVNSSVGWRGTYWTESLANGVQVPESITRQYFDFQSRITGPVFNRIFNPKDGNGHEVQARHRAVGPASAHDAHRQLRPDRPDRGPRLCRRQRDAGDLRADQPPVREAGDVAGRCSAPR